LIKNPSLKIDKHYYLSSQVHPVVSRLCDPIEGTDASFIAECLGEEIFFFLIFYYIKNYFAKNHGILIATLYGIFQKSFVSYFCLFFAIFQKLFLIFMLVTFDLPHENQTYILFP